MPRRHYFPSPRQPWPIFRTWLAILLVAALGSAIPAHAQDSGEASASNPNSSLPNLAGTGEVKLQVERFGVGGLSRPGEWAGIRIRFLDSSPKQRDIIIRLSGLDPDGDTPLVQREITANPGVWQSTWMYCRLPFWFNGTDALTLSASEAIDAQGQVGPEVSSSGFRAGRLLGRVQIAPRGPGSVLEPSVGLAGVVGTGTYGMMQYSTRINGSPWTPLGHELLQVSPRLEPSDFPDRWQGLLPFSVLVWGSGDPAELRGERAKAVRDWVTRGGHLVVLLPPLGETWTNKVSNELADLLPNVTIQRKEGVDLNPMRALITAKKDAVLPRSVVLHTFRPAEGTAISDAASIFETPAGECIAARRIIGSGAVTLVGLDLSNRALADRDLLEADVFWNRLLGRRGELMGSSDLTALANQTPGMTSRTATRFDSEIASQIAKTGRSAAGVLLGLSVFVLYWLAAGPLGYAYLKRKKQTRHAWLAYLGTAAVFTAIAWGGATLLRPSTASGSHLTLLDHIYGQPTQRARSWFTVLIPRYGDARIAIGEPQKAGAPSVESASTNLLTAFDAPWVDERQIATFPDARGYIVDARSPDRADVPVRSTVKQLQADWSGGPRWEMPRPIRPAATVAQQPIESTSDDAPRLWLDENRRPRGMLTHKLPGVLENVVVFVVAGQRPLNAREPQLSAQAQAFKISAWGPGDTLDLSKLGVAEKPTSAETFLDNLISSGRLFDDVTNRMSATPGGLTEQMNALAFFTQLGPPDFRSTGAGGRAQPVAQRAAAHGWDLGRWFTQPCIIIVGQLGIDKGLESPVPITLDGRAVPLTGRTVVRWVYPLDAAPPKYPAIEATGEGAPEGSPAARPLFEPTPQKDKPESPTQESPNPDASTPGGNSPSAAFEGN